MLSRVTVNIKVPHDDVILKTMEIYQKGLQFCVDNAWEKRIRNKGFFHCNSCGYSCNADLNASFNIRNRVKPLAITFGLSVNKPIVASKGLQCKPCTGNIGFLCDDGLLNARHFESPDLSYKPTSFSRG